jgi:chitinase
MASKEFSKMVKLRETREKFINHLIQFLRFYEFDGVDLDWEFPGERGGSPDDKVNFAIFLKEFRQAINEELIDEDRESLILSAAVGAGRRRVELGYDIKAMVKELDFINMMT